MNCWFFMSYARVGDQQDDANLVRTFYDELKGEVASLVSNQTPPVGYLDQEDLEEASPR